MADFQIHTAQTAPAEAAPMLEQSQSSYGMIPNLHGVMAESPQLLEAYKRLGSLFSQSSLSTTEQHIVWLTLNVYHGCHYCVPAHTLLAKNDKVDDAIIDALRNNQPLADARYEALRQFTLALADQRGQVSDAVVQTFLDAGFTKANVLDVLLGLSHKVLSNYTNHLADTPVDAPFAAFSWQPAAVAAE